MSQMVFSRCQNPEEIGTNVSGGLGSQQKGEQADEEQASFFHVFLQAGRGVGDSERNAVKITSLSPESPVNLLAS